MVLFLRHYRKPVTGAHYRYDRVVRFAAKSDNLILLSPYVEPEIENKISCYWFELPFLNSVTVKTFLAALLNFFKLLKYRNKVKVIIVFGETTAPAALLVSLILSAPISAGLRSNVRKRHEISLAVDGSKNIYLKRMKFRTFDIFLSFFYKFSNQIIVQTELAKEVFIDQYRIEPAKVRVVNNDMPIEFKKQFYESPFSCERAKKILFIGNSTRIKGFDIYIEALKNIPADTFNKLTFVGVSTNDIAPLLSLGFEAVSIEQSGDIANLMLEHDALVVPSREDQFPNVVLEALAIGLPVVGSNVDGIKYMINDDKFLFESGDVDSLTILLNLITDSGFYDSCHKNILKQRSRFDFCWEQDYLNNVMSVFND